MAGARAITLGQEFDLQLAEFRTTPQIIMAHKAIEIERRGRPHIGVDRHNLWHRLDPVRSLDKRALGILQRRTLGQIRHHFQFRLVVEGQQLDRHGLGNEQHAGQNSGDADACQEPAGALPGADDRLGDPAIKRAEPAFVMTRMRPFGDLVRMRDPHHQPRRDHHGDEEGEQHRDRGIRRNRRHIGAHQAGDEHHRQQGRDDGQRRHDGRVTNLGHGLDRRLDRMPPVAHAPVAVNILDHHDCIIDQDAYGEDQREQADAVDGVAHEI